MQLQINLSPRRPRPTPVAFPGFGRMPVNAVPFAATIVGLIAAAIGSFWIAGELHTDEGGMFQLVLGLAIALVILTHPVPFRDRWLWSVRGVFVGKAAFVGFIIAGGLLAAVGVVRMRLRAEDVAACRIAFFNAENSHQRATVLRTVPRPRMSQALQILADWHPESCGYFRESGAF